MQVKSHCSSYPLQCTHTHFLLQGWAGTSLLKNLHFQKGSLISEWLRQCFWEELELARGPLQDPKSELRSSCLLPAAQVDKILFGSQVYGPGSLISHKGALSLDGYRSFVLGTWWGMSYSAMMPHRVRILTSFWLLRVITNCVIGDYVRDWDLKILWYWIYVLSNLSVLLTCQVAHLNWYIQNI